MAGIKRLSIGEVARSTGLTRRTLRFYEEQGLIEPPRSASGRREYGARELTTLHRITVLKQAGFALARIRELLGNPAFHGERIIEAQIAALEAERAHIERALACLAQARKAAAGRRTLDIETLCNLIQLGEPHMMSEELKRFIDAHYTPHEQQRWMDAKLEAAGGDAQGYLAKWNDLIARIEQALPLDPASDEAQAMHDEWRALVAPFAEALAPDMKIQAQIASSIEDPSVPSPISEPVRAFIRAAGNASKQR